VEIVNTKLGATSRAGRQRQLPQWRGFGKRTLLPLESVDLCFGFEGLCEVGELGCDEYPSGKVVEEALLSRSSSNLS